MTEEKEMQLLDKVMDVIFEGLGIDEELDSNYTAEQAEILYRLGLSLMVFSKLSYSSEANQSQLN